jgi:hypothetical protein
MTSPHDITLSARWACLLASATALAQHTPACPHRTTSYRVYWRCISSQLYLIIAGRSISCPQSLQNFPLPVTPTARASLHCGDDPLASHASDCTDHPLPLPIKTFMNPHSSCIAPRPSSQAIAMSQSKSSILLSRSMPLLPPGLWRRKHVPDMSRGVYLGIDCKS